MIETLGTDVDNRDAFTLNVMIIVLFRMLALLALLSFGKLVSSILPTRVAFQPLLAVFQTWLVGNRA